MKPHLTILIPTYQNVPVAQMCFMSLVKYTEYPYKIVILNNDPQLVGQEALSRAIPCDHMDNVSIVSLGGNRGWMGAINAGMEYVDTPYMCMLNDDVLFIPGQREFWRILLRHMGPGSRVAAVGPCSNFVLGKQSLFALATPPAFPAPFLIGFCMVVDVEKFKQVGMLDETLPGGDDFDLSIRLRRAGYDLIAEKTAYLHHIGSVTGHATQGKYWNSVEQGDVTNNAIMRKHSLKEWYGIVTPQDRTPSVDEPGLHKELRAEDKWWVEHIPQGKRGLNVGCGDNKLPGTTGVDRSKAGERAAGGRKFTGATPDMTADAMDLPVQDGTLDFIAARHLFEHLLDPVAALREWKRALKPGGELLISCPDHSNHNTMVVDYTHVHAYTKDSLANLLKLAGFDVLELDTFLLGVVVARARLVM